MKPEVINAIRFVLDFAQLEDIGFTGQGWKSDKMIESIKILRDVVGYPKGYSGSTGDYEEMSNE